MGPITVHTTLSGSRDVVVGSLYAHHRRGAESATFTYTVGYVATPGAYPLDPQLPLATGQWQTSVGQRMFGALADCAPDRWGRTLVKRQEAALAHTEGRAARELSEDDYLLGVRDDLRQGSLRLTVDGGPFLAQDATGVPTLTELPELLHLAANYERDGDMGLAEIRRLVGAGSSLGGARPKTHVRDTSGRLAIAKFPSPGDAWDVIAWEKVALDLAAAAGVTVPTSRLVTISDRRVLIVDRFDRADGLRIGYVSAMTMLEAVDHMPRTYLEIAEAIEAHSGQATADLHQLWRRIVIGALLHNTDDHLRNHGFVHAGAGRWRLAPAFDLNPNPEPGAHATAISDAHPDTNIEAALDVASYFRLNPAAAQAVLDDVVGALRMWRTVARTHGLDAASINQMAPAFADVPG